MIYFVPFIAIAIFLTIKMHNSWTSWLEAAVISTLLSFLIMMIPTAAGTIGAEVYAEHHAVRYVQNDELQQLSTGTNTSGTFFLGSGTIRQSPVYYYYYKTDNGDYRMDYVFAYHTTIREDADAGTARLEYTCDWIDTNEFWTWPIDNDHWNCHGPYVFHVPPGSVAYNINMSLPTS